MSRGGEKEEEELKQILDFSSNDTVVTLIVSVSSHLHLRNDFCFHRILYNNPHNIITNVSSSPDCPCLFRPSTSSQPYTLQQTNPEWLPNGPSTVMELEWSQWKNLVKHISGSPFRLSSAVNTTRSPFHSPALFIVLLVKDEWNIFRPTNRSLSVN